MKNAASRSAGWSDPTGLTYDDGLQTSPSFSRDGTSIVFAAGDATHNFRIYTQRVDEDGKTAGTPMAVTKSATHDSQPDWSPTGDLIAFRRSDGDTGGIFVVPATGGMERPLTDFGYLPQWSPDGRRILFTNMLVNHLSDSFWIVTSGQDPQPLTFGRAGGGGAFGWGSGSHDIVALSAFRFPFGVKLASLNVDTRRPTSWAFDAPVLEGFREHALVVPRERLAWSEDERAIYFIGESRGQRGVWRIGVDATAHRVVAGPTRIFSAQGNAHTFALSRDGRHIAFGATRPAQLWAYDLDDAGRLRPDSATPVSREAVYAESPALSPDGRQLVSLQTQPGSRQQTNLVLRDMTAGTNSERILRTIDDIRENIAFPRWNAAGTRLSYGDYVSDTNTIRDQVRLLDPATQRDGDALTSPQVTGLVANLPGNWTPDDRFVVASSRRYVEGRDSIVLLPLDKSPHAELSPIIVTPTGRGNIHQVMVSPDGRWIVFRARLSQRLQIAIVSTSARGSDEASWITAVAKTGWNVDKPRWSPSGDRIYFSVTAGGPLSLWSIGFDSARGQVAGEPRGELIRTSPAFHLLPDIREFDLAVGGGRLVVPIVRPMGGIWISERVR